MSPPEIDTLFTDIIRLPYLYISIKMHKLQWESKSSNFRNNRAFESKSEQLKFIFFTFIGKEYNRERI